METYTYRDWSILAVNAMRQWLLSEATIDRANLRRATAATKEWVARSLESAPLSDEEVSEDPWLGFCDAVRNAAVLVHVESNTAGRSRGRAHRLRQIHRRLSRCEFLRPD